MKDSFAAYHPLVNFLHFLLVLTFSMTLMNPFCLAVSMVSAFAYSIYLRGKRAARFNFLILLPLLLITALLTPAFSHEGATILAYLPGGNPLTLESILYGIAAAAMLVAVICWFSCYNAVFTSDKFIYLFGRVIPAFSLVLSMVLRFVPRFKRQFSAVAAAQRNMGREASGKGPLRRLRRVFAVFSIMLTWSLENSIETADSMKSRGYGLPGRSAFSIYRFDRRDLAALLAIISLAAYVIAGWANGGFYWRFYPTLRGAAVTPYTASLVAAYLLLCLLPVIMNLMEAYRWKVIQSKT